MAQSLLPHWFLGIGAFLELTFFIITALIAFYAWKVYNITGKRNAKSMFVAFFLFSSSYLVMVLGSIFDLTGVTLASLPAQVCSFNSAFEKPIFLLHMLLYMAGLIRLGASAFNIENRSLYYTITAVLTVSLILAANTLLLFNAITVVILIAIAYSIFAKYYKYKKPMILYFFMFVMLLLVGRIHYLVASHGDISCVFNHTLSFIAHIVLFVVVFLVMKRNFNRKEQV